MIKEYNNLIKQYGNYNISMIFNNVDSYKKVREHTSYKDVLNEVNNLLIE